MLIIWFWLSRLYLFVFFGSQGVFYFTLIVSVSVGFFCNFAEIGPVMFVCNQCCCCECSYLITLLHLDSTTIPVVIRATWNKSGYDMSDSVSQNLTRVGSLPVNSRQSQEIAKRFAQSSAGQAAGHAATNAATNYTKSYIRQQLTGSPTIPKYVNVEISNQYYSLPFSLLRAPAAIHVVLVSSLEVRVSELISNILCVLYPFVGVFVSPFPSQSNIQHRLQKLCRGKHSFLNLAVLHILRGLYQMQSAVSKDLNKRLSEYCRQTWSYTIHFPLNLSF